MNTLPPELLRCICDNFKDKKNTLKAVRLVNKDFADATAPLLFQTLLVYQTPKSLEKLSSVAKCEWLAQYVVKLEVAALQYLPHYLDFAEWKRSTWQSRWIDQYYGHNNRAGMVSVLLEKLEWQVPNPRPNPNPYRKHEDWKQYPEVRSWNDQRDQGDGASVVSNPGESHKALPPGLNSALGFEYRYERYRYWHDGENKLSDMMFYFEGRHPPLDLVPFPKLKSMTILGSHELWEGKTWHSAEADRKIRETSVHMLPEAKLRTGERNLLLSLTLQMLDASGVNITRLELHRYRQVLVDQTFPIPVLKCLQELLLDFPYHPNFGEVEGNTKLWEIAPWLQGADDLRTLSILSQDPEEHSPHRFYDVIAMFHGAEWPKLRSIHFKKTFVRPKSLLRFLNEHEQSLESVRIEKPIVLEKTWKSLASELLVQGFLSPDCIVDVSDCYPLEEGEFEDLENDSHWFDRMDWS